MIERHSNVFKKKNGNDWKKNEIGLRRNCYLNDRNIKKRQRMQCCSPNHLPRKRKVAEDLVKVAIMCQTRVVVAVTLVPKNSTRRRNKEKRSQLYVVVERNKIMAIVIAMVQQRNVVVRKRKKLRNLRKIKDYHRNKTVVLFLRLQFLRANQTVKLIN